jgi:hypothetical protein
MEAGAHIGVLGYAVIALSTLVAVILDFSGINSVKALYWTAVVNGLLEPFLLSGILVVASDSKLMQGQPSSRLGRVVGLVVTIAMFIAAIAMFALYQRGAACVFVRRRQPGKVVQISCKTLILYLVLRGIARQTGLLTKNSYKALDTGTSRPHNSASYSRRFRPDPSAWTENQ